MNAFASTLGSTLRSHGRPRSWAAALAALLLVYGAWQALRFGPGDTVLVGDLFFFPVSGAATWTAWRASRRTSAWPRLRLAWQLLALGALAYLLGDVAQTLYEVLGYRPTPSLADAFYLAFYPLTFGGLLSFPRRRCSASEGVRLALDLAAVVLAGSAVVVYVVLGPTALTNSGNLLTALFAIAYPVGDMVLLLGVGALLLRGSARSSRWSLRLLAVGVGFYVVADLIYGYMNLHAGYQGGDRVDALWMIAISVIAVAGATQSRSAGPEQLRAGNERVSRLPYAAVALVFGVLVFSDRHDPLFPGLTMTLIAFGLAVLVSVRQFLGQRDLLGVREQLLHQALHDGLTGLPNRTLVLDRVSQLIARSSRTLQPPVVLFIDLDGFKQVNDSFGHAAGDRLITVVAERLRAVLRPGDTVGRLGGDEFVIALDQEGEVATPELVAERVLSVLRGPYDHISGGRRLAITASIGIAASRRATAHEMLRDADIALYRAKDEGRDRWVIFEAGMQTAVEDRMWLELDLVDAIAQHQLFVEYQPTVDLRSRRITGVEALVRWRHPMRGIVPPNAFIPVAEDTNLIVPLGRAVLAEACERAANWHLDGYPVRMAVNVSGRQLDDESFVADVEAILEESGLDPALLTLEITETALMRDAAAAAETLGAIKALGVRVSVDDFGTGYSSLAYLRQFPVDALKIDRAFVAGIAVSESAATLLRTLVQLGKTLGLEVVGEGVETEAQLDRLCREGCDVGQGFLFGRPLGADETEELLAAAFQSDRSVVLRLAIGESPDAVEHDPVDAMAI